MASPATRFDRTPAPSVRSSPQPSVERPSARVQRRRSQEEAAPRHHGVEPRGSGGRGPGRHPRGRAGGGGGRSGRRPPRRPAPQEQVAGAEAHRRRRLRHGLQGAGREGRVDRGTEDPGGGPDHRGRGGERQETLPARSPDHEATGHRVPAHRGAEHLRGGPGGGTHLLPHGVRGRGAPGRPGPGRRSPAGGAGRPAGPPGVRGAHRGPRGPRRCGPPGPEARELHAHQGPGLRHRQAGGEGGRQPPHHRGDAGNPRVRRPGAAPRRAGGRPDRPLRLRRGAVRPPHRPGPVAGREGGRAHHRDLPAHGGHRPG